MALGWSENSIIHTGLSSGSLGQIIMRGETLKKKSGRTTKDLVYLNSKTSWVKISSAVDIAEDTEGKKFSSKLAQSNVLAAGTLNSKQKIRSGIFSSNDDAYTLDSTGTGYRPLPGITGFQSEILGTYGTYQRVSIDFQVNSLDQLSVLESLYLRPGMSLLVEWGHSIYKKNNGEVVTTIETIDEFFDNIGSGKEAVENAKNKIYDEIDRLKGRSFGNYDAFLGKVTNFNYKFNPDGTYSCQTTVLAHGALLESVRLLMSSTTSDDAPNETVNLARNVSRFTTFFETMISAGINSESTIDTNKIVEALQKEIPDDYNLLLKRLEKSNRKFKALSVGKSTDTDNPRDKILQFVPLYVILDLINIIFCPKTDVEKDVNDVEFYTGDPDGKNTTPYLTFPGHFSINPTICFLPKIRDDGFPLSYFFTNSEDIESDQDNILDIMVSVNYVLTVFSDLIDPSTTDKNDQTVYDLVRIILKGITESLGNLNIFDFHYPSQRDKVYIVDRKVTPKRQDIENSLLKVRGPESTMKEFSIESKLSANLMTTMAIGASAQGTDLGEDMLNVQSWNKGLRDRFNSNPGFLGNNTRSDQAEKSISQQKFVRLLDYIKELDRSTLEEQEGTLTKVPIDSETVQYDPFTFINYNAEEASAIRPVYEKVMQDLYKVQTKKLRESAAGLIPIDVSFKMTGISGFKIGQAFTIEEGTLPKKYNDKVGFIIKSISHVIGSDNQWYTDVNAIMTILSEPIIDLEDNFNISDYIKKNLVPIAVPAPEKPILTWPISIIDTPIGFEKSGTPGDSKRFYFFGGTSGDIFEDAIGQTFRPGVVRSDAEGAGTFGQKRQNSAGKHEGLDLLTTPGQAIMSPIDGNVRFGATYTAQGGHYIEVTGTGAFVGYVCRIAYVNVGYKKDNNVIFKDKVKAGQPICYSADMINGYEKQTSDGEIIENSEGKPERWPGYEDNDGNEMLNHIHFEIKYNQALVNPAEAPYKAKFLS